LAGTVNIDTQDTVRGFQSLVVKFSGQTDSLSEIDLTQPTINDLQAIAD
jgi:hypothetical protein